MGEDWACRYEPEGFRVLEERENRGGRMFKAATEGDLKRDRHVGGKGRRCVRRLYSIYRPVECQDSLSHKMGSHEQHFTKLAVRDL